MSFCLVFMMSVMAIIKIRVFFGVYFYQINERPNIRRLLLGCMLLFPVYGFLNFTFIQDLHVFNSYPRTVEAILLIAFSLVYFYIQTIDNPTWHAQPETWIVMGILIYFSSSLVQFSFSNVVSSLASRDTKLFIWAAHATLVLIMYLLFAVGFAKCKA